MSGDHDRYKWVESKEEIDKLRDEDMGYDSLVRRVEKLEEYDEFLNLSRPRPNTDEADEFVRKELLNMYTCCDDRDSIALEYVIRMVSTPAQWKHFWEANELRHMIAIGEQ